MNATAPPKRLSPASVSDAPRPMLVPPAVSESSRTVVISEEVARGLEERIRATAFPTLDAFVGFVLARLLEEPEGTAFSEEEERRLRERLRSLGYID